jgi:hypothetical protein
MVARGPGAVGCAHCTLLGAEVACAVCGHLVCEKCGADWSTCGLPSGRMVRLGTTARLLDVDPLGRYGLVARWHGPLKVVDLRALKWVAAPSLPGSGTRDLRPRLTVDGRLVYPEFRFSTQRNEGSIFVGITQQRIDRYAISLLEDVPNPVRATGVSPHGERYWYVSDTELVTVIDLGERGGPPVVYEPLPKKVVQAAFVDGERALVAAGTWGEIAVHRIVDGRLVLAGHAPTTGDAVWLGVAGPYLAARVRGGAGRGVTVWRLGDDLSVRSVALRIEDNVDGVALSRDGRYLAAGLSDGNRVIVRGLDDGSSATFEEHTDTVSFVKFAGDDHLLVTADDDNRVVLRPRGPEGYARVVLDSKLADA